MTKLHIFSKLTALAALLLSAGAGPSAAQAPAPPVPLGVQLDGASLFVDVMKTGSDWYTPFTPGAAKAPTDANGWPLTDATCIFFDNTLFRSDDPNPPADGYLAGTYHLSFTGHAALSPGGGGSAFTVANQTYDIVTNTTNADLVVPPGTLSLYVAFTQTGVQNVLFVPSPGGVQNVKLTRPGYAAGTSQVFTDEYVNYLTKINDFSVLRCMGLLSTNSTNPQYPLQTNWSDRTLTTDDSQADHTQLSGAVARHGVAWEYLIQLANQTHKDLWINVPVSASDDYVTQLATLLKNTLDPALHVYVEYSNEVWNGGFTQYDYNLRAANAEAPTLLYDSQSDPVGTASEKDQRLSGRRYVERVVQISDLFKAVYGAPAINDRVRPVLAWQEGSTETRDMLRYAERITGGAPTQKLYGQAWAFYYGCTDAQCDTLDDLFAGLDANITSEQRHMEQLRALATFDGLKAMAYEGGMGLVGTTNLGNKFAAQRDPRVKGTTRRNLDTFFQSGNDLYMYFSLEGAWSQFGFWGLSEDVFTPTYKTQAILDFAAAPVPAMTSGFALPAPGQTLAVPGVSYTAGYYMDSGNFSPGPTDVAACTPYTNNTGTVFEYLLRSSAPGQYNLSLTTTDIGFAGVQSGVYLDGQSVGPVTVVANGTSASVPVTLGPGPHALRLTGFTGSFSLKSINFSQPNPAPADVTPSVGLRFSGLRFDRAHGLFHQTATLTNTGGAALAGPLYLVLDGLTPGVGLSDSASKTADTSPVGSPYVSSASGLAPNASVSLDLAFYNPRRLPLAYTPRVLAGPGAP